MTVVDVHTIGHILSLHVSKCRKKTAVLITLVTFHNSAANKCAKLPFLLCKFVSKVVCLNGWYA